MDNTKYKKSIYLTIIEQINIFKCNLIKYYYYNEVPKRSRNENDIIINIAYIQ